MVELSPRTDVSEKLSKYLIEINNEPEYLKTAADFYLVSSVARYWIRFRCKVKTDLFLLHCLEIMWADYCDLLRLSSIGNSTQFLYSKTIHCCTSIALVVWKLNPWFHLQGNFGILQIFYLSFVHMWSESATWNPWSHHAKCVFCLSCWK